MLTVAPRCDSPIGVGVGLLAYRVEKGTSFSRTLFRFTQKTAIRVQDRGHALQSQANVEKIADLARLSFSEEERDELQEQFQKILGYFEQIQGLETDNVDPMVTPHQYPSALREDRVDQDLSLQDILKNAPDVKDDLFKVPPVV